MVRNCTYIIFLLNLFFSATGFTQDQPVIARKNIPPLSPTLEKLLRSKIDDSTSYVFVFETSDHGSGQQLQTLDRRVVKQISEIKNGFGNIRCTPKILLSLLESGIFISAELFVVPKEEGGVINHDFSVNAISAAHEYFSSYNGTAQVISVKENRMDTQDIDIAGRYVDAGTSASLGSTHATTMTTIIAGRANTSFRGKGVAWNSRYSSSDFSTVLPDPAATYKNNGIGVQNHSYGTTIQNWYGTNARAFDLSSNTNPALLHIFSSGNSGNATPADGRYAGITGVATLTGNMKMAKNILVVGAIDTAGHIPSASSGGPAYDGRIKPDLVAFAEEGSSGAAALTSGAASVLQQAWFDMNGTAMRSDLIRAIFLNTADDVAASGPDYRSGFGSLNLYNALRTVKDKRSWQATVFSSDSAELPITVPEHAGNLKVTLTWNDPASSAMSARSLVNNLDLRVYRKPTTESWLPWILKTIPDSSALFAAATRGRDTLNNAEQVTIAFPLGGEYIIQVRSDLLLGDQQDFSVAWQYDTLNRFTWQYPAGTISLEAGKELRLRWLGTFDDLNKGELGWSADSISWSLIGSEVELQNKNYRWIIPEINGRLFLRMIIDGDTIITGPHNTGFRPGLKTGWICDSALIYWNSNSWPGPWNVYRYDGDTMAFQVQVHDTSAIVPLHGFGYFSVSPVISQQSGPSSSTIDIYQQGTGCYINAFLADLVNENEARVRLELGTTYGIRRVLIKKSGNPEKILLNEENINRVFFEFFDQQLHPGMNTYIAEVELDNNRKWVSDPVTVYYNAGKPQIIFPNPASQGSTIYLLQDEVKDLRLQIFDATGRLISSHLIVDKLNPISTSGMTRGIYYFVVKDEDGIQTRYKVIVL